METIMKKKERKLYILMSLAMCFAAVGPTGTDRIRYIAPYASTLVAIVGISGEAVAAGSIPLVAALGWTGSEPYE